MKMKKLLQIFSIILLLNLATLGYAGSIKDSESASHSDAASGYDIVDTLFAGSIGRPDLSEQD